MSLAICLLFRADILFSSTKTDRGMGNIQKPFRNHNSPVPGRERFVSINGRKKKTEIWGHTDWERFQSSGGELESDHKKACKQRMRPLWQTWFIAHIHTRSVPFSLSILIQFNFIAMTKQNKKHFSYCQIVQLRCLILFNLLFYILIYLLKYYFIWAALNFTLIGPFFIIKIHYFIIKMVQNDRVVQIKWSNILTNK